jgi:uncharacterized protein
VTLPRPHERVRGVAVLYPNTLHVVTRADSGLVRLGDLGGKRVAVSYQDESPSTREEGRWEAIAAAIAHDATQHVPPIAVTVRSGQAVRALQERRVDAATFYGGPPFNAVTEAARSLGINILQFDDAAISLVKASHPYMKPATIPASTYLRQDRPVRTLAVDNILMCSADLTPELAYRLTRALYEEIGTIAAVHAAARQIDSENGALTPIPLHEGASRYYRERELFR